MSSVNLIARLVGPLFVAIGLGVLLHRPLYEAAITEAVKSTTLVFLSGVACLRAAVVILNAYRAWTADWRVLVTIVAHGGAPGHSTFGKATATEAAERRPAVIA
jgi:hypothetical protein